MKIAFWCTEKSYEKAIILAKQYEQIMGYETQRIGGATNNIHYSLFYKNQSSIRVIKATDNMIIERADITFIAEDINWDYIQLIIKPSAVNNLIFYFSTEVINDKL